MKSNQRTYHFISALTFLVFLSAVLLPVGIKAAGLLCDMEIAGPQMSTEQSCDIRKMDNHGEAFFTSDNTDCETRQICVQSNSNKDFAIEATMPHLPINIAAIAIEAFHLRILGNDSPVINKGSQINIPYSQPPLFLLNSTFLN